MNRTFLFNDKWEFSKQPLHTEIKEMMEGSDQFRPVRIPYDWLIANTDNLYEDGTGWYRKFFVWEGKEDESCILRFDGVYMDSRIYVNPKLPPEQYRRMNSEPNTTLTPEPVFEWKYGYSTFEADITPWLHEGENSIWVSVNHQAPNSRWYTGAGIYRNVWMKIRGKCHLVSDGIYFHAEKKADTHDRWLVTVSAEIATVSAGNMTKVKTILPGEPERQDYEIKFYLCGQDGTRQFLGQGDSVTTEITAPKIWDVTEPNTYQLEVELYDRGQLVERQSQTVGFRQIQWNPDQGLLLNGRKLKLNGVCEHFHDSGCLGAAFHVRAAERKMKLFKEMGVNAIRLAHNMPAPEVMELADQMGFLMVSEAFDMWESTKNPYDYGRFFTQWYERDTASWVRRDRNHPSLLLWSIGNEIYDTHTSDRGQMWTRILMEEVERHDPLHNCRVTIGSNYMPWENAQKCADIYKLPGYNYGAAYYADHHRSHPDWVIYGSETASIVQSRGIYHFPYSKSVLADVDEQCSSLGNSTTSWGARSAEVCIAVEREYPFSAGQFLWSGTDYIGEPTPYHTRNSYFGQIDTAGFKKDSFYIYKAEWTDPKVAPMVHLFPYWDFNEGQLIDVRAYSNGASVELFLNGESQGKKILNHVEGEAFTATWQVPYQTGEIRCLAYDEDGKILAQDAHHSFGEPARIILTPSKTELLGDGEDLLFLEISMVDENGCPVENAVNRVLVTVDGAAELVGTDNGDSTEIDGYQTGCKRLFSGKLLAVVRAGTGAGRAEITVQSPGLPQEKLLVNVKSDICDVTYAEVSTTQDVMDPNDSNIIEIIDNTNSHTSYNRADFYEFPVRNLRLRSSKGTHLGPDNQSTLVTAEICPDNADDQTVEWAVVDDAGISSPLAEIIPDGRTVTVKARSDGQFRLRCMSRSGRDKIRIISQLEFTVEGLGKAYLDPYGFIAGGLYDYSSGNIGNGNEHGFATARDGESQVGFHNLDFGSYGSDEIFLPVFALTDDPYEIQIYEGMPGEEGAQLIGDYLYQKVHIWNVYQPETYRLKKRLRGVTSICFVLKAKVHIKGFSFVKKNKAYETLFAGECDKIYGDSYQKEEKWVRGIGNNVTLEYFDMDFGTKGPSRITIEGQTPLEKNTIILRIERGDQVLSQQLSFLGGEQSHTYEIHSDELWKYELQDDEAECEIHREGAHQAGETAPVCRYCHVSFLFLPGSQFDFYGFSFE